MLNIFSLVLGTRLWRFECTGNFKAKRAFALNCFCALNRDVSVDCDPYTQTSANNRLVKPNGSTVSFEMSAFSLTVTWESSLHEGSICAYQTDPVSDVSWKHVLGSVTTMISRSCDVTEFGLRFGTTTCSPALFSNLFVGVSFQVCVRHAKPETEVGFSWAMQQMRTTFVDYNSKQSC